MRVLCLEFGAHGVGFPAEGAQGFGVLGFWSEAGGSGLTFQKTCEPLRVPLERYIRGPYEGY